MRVGDLTTSHYVVYDYTTSSYTDMWSICLLYIQYIHVYIQYTYICV